MLISLVVLSGVMALAAHLATGQLRFFRSSAELATLRGDASQAAGIAASVLRGVSPHDDVEVALDSAIEVHMPIGTALACSYVDGVLAIPATTAPSGNTVASFSELPEPGDRLFALQVDSAGDSWSTHIVTETGALHSPCASIPGVSAARWIRVQDQATIPPATVLRFARPFRLSLYRSSDGRSYLGARDWSSESRRFNTIQPVAGPLRPYDPDASRTGLLFRYQDAAGLELEPPVDRQRLAMITIVARATSGSLTDSSSLTIALRNAR